MFRSALRIAGRMASSVARRDRAAAFDYELWLWFFAGVVRQRWTDRHRQPAFMSRPLDPVQEPHAAAR